MTDSTKPKPRWKKILLLQLVLWPTLFLTADLVVRFTTGYSSYETLSTVSEVVEAMTSGVPEAGRTANLRGMQSELGLHPYTAFGPRGLVASHSREFERASEATREQEYRIMILGGSVAGGFGNLKSSGVGELRKALARDPRFEGRHIRFIPQGYGSYKQPQQLILANFMIASGVVPHAIVNLDGFNEVALSLQNSYSGMHPSYPSFARWVHLSTNWGSDTNLVVDALVDIREARERAVDFGELSLNLGLHYSSLLGPMVVRGMRSLKWKHSDASQAYEDLLRSRPGIGLLKGPKFLEGEKSVLNTAVEMWAESSVSLSALCRERGIYYLNVLQPTLHDKGSKELTEEEITTGAAEKSWVLGAGRGYPMLRERGAQLREEGVNFFDASMAFRNTKDTLYYDACHFSSFGNAILGRMVGQAFLADLPEGELPR